VTSFGPYPGTKDRWIVGILFGTPFLILALSYVLLAERHRAWNLFPVVVHENGVYTLLHTIFYFRHFVRELLINSFVVVAVAATASLHSPLSSGLQDERLLRSIQRGLGWFVLVGVAIVILIVWTRLGAAETFRELLQYRTRDDLDEYGSHWRDHLLHLVDAVLFGLGSATALRGLAGASPTQSSAVKWLAVWAAAFVMVTLIFGAPLRALTEPLILAHQAREIETHRLLSIWPAFGVIWILDRRFSSAAPHAHRGMLIDGVGWMVVATAIPLWIVWPLRHVDIPALAQRHTDLFELAAAHHFEHTLDYFFIVAASSWLYLNLNLARKLGRT